MSSFRLPDLGEGLEEAEIVAWHVGVGDHVTVDQPLLTVETDKAVVEIPSPRSGVVATLHGQPWDVVKVGAALVEFAETAAADRATVVGVIPAAPVSKTEAAGPVAMPRRGPGIRTVPAVRALARQLGVELAAVRATGPEGSITRANVEAAAGTGVSAPAEPLHGVRRAMAQHMVRAHAEVVPATVTEDADIGGWGQGEDVTIRLVRAIVAGCRAEPALNAHYLGPERGRVLHPQIHLGIAMDTPDGLLVPVLRDVGGRDPASLRRGLAAMTADAAARRIPREELRGQTITLSNFGMFGGRYAQLVVLPPQVAILGAGRIAARVVVRGGEPAVSRVLPLSLTFDHRVVMGGEAARFLAAVIADLQRAT
jgi:2-oxoisovalerate dehydrogenase E2 component (dihydrolipoyl transacylase)